MFPVSCYNTVDARYLWRISASTSVARYIPITQLSKLSIDHSIGRPHSWQLTYLSPFLYWQKTAYTVCCCTRSKKPAWRRYFGRATRWFGVEALVVDCDILHFIRYAYSRYTTWYSVEARPVSGELEPCVWHCSPRRGCKVQELLTFQKDRC